MALVLFMNRTNAEHMVHVAGSAARIRMCFFQHFCVTMHVWSHGRVAFFHDVASITTQFLFVIYMYA